MNVVIMGCGRVGARVASLLDQNGHKITVVDTHSRSFERLAHDFAGDTVIGTGIDEDILKMAGIEKADAFIAVTNHDNRNLMAAQVAQTIFKVPLCDCLWSPTDSGNLRNSFYDRVDLVLSQRNWNEWGGGKRLPG